MNIQPRILLVEDDADWQEIYRRCLSDANYEIVATRKLITALSLLEEQPFDVILTDLKMFGGAEEFSGFSVLEHAKKINPDVQVIVITGYGSADHALRAMGNGAYDYITKDRELRKKLPLTVQSALEVRSLKQELLGNRSQDDTRLESDRIIGNSANMQTLFEKITQAANSSTNVLIYGEPGTGKRLIAQTIHRRSSRKNAPFWVIDCGGLSESFLESEFLGYEADVHHPGSKVQNGKFERATGGTIFLDSVCDLGKRFQSHLVNILSERAVVRVGGHKKISVDVRIIASSDKDLVKMVESNEFRRNLFDILNENNMSVPPLRERKDGDDILALAAMFLQWHHKNSRFVLSKETIELLGHYNYPGNVRELESNIKYALSMSKDGIIKPEHLHPELRNYKPSKRTRENSPEISIVETTVPIKEDESLFEVNLSKLYRQIDQHFSESELRTLCFDLKIDYQSLDEVGKSGKARELVDHMKRHHRLVELINICRSLRPAIDW